MAGTRQEPNGAPGSIYISLAAVFLVQAERRCARSDRRGEEYSSWHLSDSTDPVVPMSGPALCSETG